MNDISERTWDLDALRRAKKEELMGSWMDEVYYPMRKQIVKDCALQGHRKSKFYTNGLGWSWYYCGACGGRTQIEGPEGETRLDDGMSNNEQEQ